MEREEGYTRRVHQSATHWGRLDLPVTVTQVQWLNPDKAGSWYRIEKPTVEVRTASKIPKAPVKSMEFILSTSHNTLNAMIL